ncbi:MAG: repressor LexA [Spirochaetales bacterium]|nr:repressor LexA [Spirochaetales bacterium]
MNGLTTRQKEILNFLYRFREEKGYSPSYREIAAHFGFSTKAAFDHLQALQKKGAISSTDNVSRSNKVIATEYVDGDAFHVSVPVLGRVAAGLPLICEENKDSELSLPASLLPNRSAEYFAMRVSGQSMVDLGIMDGDMAILEQCQTAENGQIVMATYGEYDGVTLKRIYFHPGNVELRPANPSFNPVFTRDCRILGKLVLTIRSY